MARKYFLTVALFALGVATGVIGVTFLGASVQPAPPTDEGPRVAPMPGPGMRPGPMGGTPPAGITVSGGFVYVLLGNMVFKLDASDLKVVSQKMLGEPGPGPMPPMGQPPR